MNGRVDSEDNKSESSSSQSSIMSSLKEAVCEKRIKQMSKQHQHQEMCISDSTSSNSDSFNNRLSTNSISSNNSSTHSYTSHLAHLEIEKLLNDMVNIIANEECYDAELSMPIETKYNSNLVVVDVIDEETSSMNETLFKNENKIQAALKRNEEKKLPDILAVLKSNLDDLRANYIELNDFSDLMTQLEQLITKTESRNKSNHSEDRNTNLSLSLDNVLQCFDFLDLENVDNNEATTTTTVKNKVEKRNSTSSTSSSSNNEADCNSSNYSLKSKQDNQLIHLFDFETLLIIHFKNCIYLLNNLNELSKNGANEISNEKQPNFSQLEAVVFDKLNRETNILREILKIFNKIVANETSNESNEMEIKMAIKEYFNNSDKSCFRIKEKV